MGSIFLPDALEDLADTGGFLRSQRSRVARSRTHRLADLAQLDERLEAHLDALLIAAEADPGALAAARASGGCFVEAFVAVRLRRPALLREIVRRARQGDAAKPDLAGERPPEGGGGRDLIAALGWAPWAEADAATAALAEDRADSAAAALRLHAARVHRRDPGDPLADAAAAGDPALRAAALRAAGELGRVDLAGLLGRALDDGDAACRGWAAWSGALLGERRCNAAIAALARAGEGALGDRGLEMAARVLPPEAAEALVREVAAAGQERRALAAAASFGDARLVPWILALAERPGLARLAGWAFSAITGIAVAERAPAAPPPGFRTGPTDDPWEHDVGLDPDARLPWPDAKKLLALWADASGAFTAGARYRLGRPIEPAAILDALAGAPQALRASAALDASLLQPGRPLLAVLAPAFRQIRALRLRERRPDGAPHVAAR